ncbi:L-fucose:H+ symporter permease [Mucilaginibacter calamicampi]|uniref:L-fucose:H+ symporter permease n=1 Tax=Mucilaginibacter calamicampi TaxID=1302352 RepID=A0ABW2YZ89_9SPHI
MNQNSTTGQQSAQTKGYLFPFIMVTTLFFLWGFIHNLDPVLIPHLKKAFTLSDLETAFIDSSVYAAYFAMALPAGYFMRKFGYKGGIILGLVLFAIGSFLFLPAADTRQYIYFLGALFIIACGLTFLETAANPYVTILGPPETSVQRLNFSQSFNGLAASLAPFIGVTFIMSDSADIDAKLATMPVAEQQTFLNAQVDSVKTPYMIIGIVILLIAVIVIFTKLPDIKENKDELEGSSIGHALKHSHLTWGIIAQFFYVGAQVCVISFFLRYITGSTDMPESQAKWYQLVAGLAFMVGRFAGTVFMRYIAPNRLLILYALLCAILTSVAVLAGGMLGIYALIGVCFFMSIMFPTIFSMGIAGLGKDTKLGSSLIVMSIVGGALLPLGLGYISDATGQIRFGYVVPILCFVVIMFYGWKKWAPVVKEAPIAAKI